MQRPSGRLYVGKTLNNANSKIEGSYTGPPDVDVSYVDGYSLPVTCSSQGVVVSGCNIPLFNDGHTCGHVDNNGPVCINPQAGVPNGPATPFFAPCQVRCPDQAFYSLPSLPALFFCIHQS